MQHEDGRLVTIPVHAGKDIGRGLLRKIWRDAKISREEFIELLESELQRASTIKTSKVR